MWLPTGGVVRYLVPFVVLQVMWACRCGTSWFLLRIFLFNSLLISYSQILLRKTSNALMGSFPGVSFLSLPPSLTAFWCCLAAGCTPGCQKAALLLHQNGALNICGRWSQVQSGLQITAFLFLPSVLVPRLTASG